MAEEPRDPVAQAAGQRSHAWWRVLLIGGALYFVGVGIFALTDNPNLFPTVIMLGSFLVPAAFVAFFYERRFLSRLTMPTVGLAFFYGGVLGVFAASLLEPLLVPQLDFFTAFLVGLIEEGAKILGVLVIARHRRHDSEMDGLILGAAAGMGFAALESTGYAFTAFLRSGGSLSQTVIVILARGLLSPLGHGTWTAIFAAVLFREGHVNHFHFDRKVIGAYLLVSGLHGLWDGVPAALTALFGSGVAIAAGELAVGGAGLYLLAGRYRDARQRQLARLAGEAGESAEARAAPEARAAGEAGDMPEESPERGAQEARRER